MLWVINVHFCLDYQATVLYIEWGHDLDVCCGVGWGLLHPELLDVSGYFGGRWGRRRQQVGIMSTSDSQLKDCTVSQADRENWWFPTLGLFVRFRQTEKKKKRKKNRVWSQEVFSITHPLRPLYQLKCSPCPLVPWSSVHTLLYQCELVSKAEPHHGRGSSMQGISYGDDKREKKAERAKWWCVRQPRGYQRQEAAPTPRAGGTLGGGTSTRGSTLQSRAQELGCQSGDHRARVLTVDLSCILSLWLCGAPCILFTCFWLSSCHPHRQPVVCSLIHETTSLYLLSMETHTRCLL